MTNFEDIKTIYKITFGLQYDLAALPNYINELFVSSEDPEKGIPVSIYAQIIENKIIDLVTGTEIPAIYKRSIPGFGAYVLTPLTSIEDYETFLYDYNFSTKHISAYKEALSITVKDLDRIRKEYCSTHCNSNGLLTMTDNQEYKSQQESLKTQAQHSITTHQETLQEQAQLASINEIFSLENYKKYLSQQDNSILLANQISDDALLKIISDTQEFITSVLAELKKDVSEYKNSVLAEIEITDSTDELPENSYGDKTSDYIYHPAYIGDNLNVSRYLLEQFFSKFFIEKIYAESQNEVEAPTSKLAFHGLREDLESLREPTLKKVEPSKTLQKTKSQVL